LGDFLKRLAASIMVRFAGMVASGELKRALFKIEMIYSDEHKMHLA
jgi:hypothetical protein